MSTQNAVKLLYELRVVLDRLAENDSTLHEAMAHDVEEAIRLADECLAELTPGAGPGESASEENR